MRAVVLTAMMVLAFAGVATARGEEEASEQRAEGARWAASVRAPHSSSGRGDAALHAACGAPDAALARVAAAIVRRRAEGAPPPSALALSELLRATGCPYVRPRAWSIAGVTDPATVETRLSRWAAASPDLPMRCGLARGADAAGRPIVAAVSAPAPADLEPLPSRVRSGQWLSLDAPLHVRAHGAKVVLLGPRGRPRRVLASLSGGVVRSRFSLDREGRWLVQLVAELDDGPRPILEATLFVDTEPRPDRVEPAKRVPQSAEGLAMLLSEARKAEGVPQLRRNARLDRLATAHARRMAARGRIAHDVGDGPPSERVAAAGIEAESVGENVARAPTVERLHHALWRSPSHRENLLDPDFRRVGVGIVMHDGRMYAAQLFAD